MDRDFLGGRQQRNYKPIETEEYLDWYIYRRLGSYVVDWVYDTKLLPNHLTWLVFIFGLLGSLCLYFEKQSIVLMGVIFLVLSNILDCSDGELARARGTGGTYGRAFDGLVDGLVIFSILFSSVLKLGGQERLGMDGYEFWIWLMIGVLVGLSYLCQSSLFDHYRNEYLHYIQEGYSSEKTTTEHIKGKMLIRQGWWERLLLGVHYGHTLLQEKLANDMVDKDLSGFSGEEYRKQNIHLLRLWTFIGQTSHLSYIMIFALLDRMDIYFITVLSLGNLFMMVLKVVQKRVFIKLSDAC